MSKMSYILLSIEVIKRLQEIQDELNKNGARLRSGKLVRDRDDVLTHLIEVWEAYLIEVWEASK
jgi:hypothetical protein